MSITRFGIPGCSAKSKQPATEFAIESRYQHKHFGVWRPWGEWKLIGAFDTESESQHAVMVLNAIERPNVRAEYRIFEQAVQPLTGGRG